ncbi:MAG TPA: hypothetical protein VMS18_22020 [Candidatus Binatia bacterium]|nr:hypothetical protein [Candidatus Binatia bacterium]
MIRLAIMLSTLILTIATSLFAQQTEPASIPPPQTIPPTYTPKYKGDPAQSESEFVALAYVRGVVRAQKQFNKQYGHYATTLNELVHTGSFTKRMVDPNRGDYTVGFKGKKDSYVLTMMPRVLDATHRSFYAEDDGKIHADDSKPADKDSPVVR